MSSQLPGPQTARRVAERGLRRVRRAVASLELGLKELRSRRPILVYTMPKVGSSSVWASLRAARLPDPIYHVHLLTDPAKQYYRDAIARGEFVAQYREKLAEIEHVTRFLARDPGRRWKVITLVRDPVARCVSSFFQGRWKYLRDVDFTRPVSPERMAELTRQFEGKLAEYLALSRTWFRDELQTLFDFDVFSRPFDRARGYQIYEGSRADLLAIRLEDLDRCHRDAFREFLGLADFALVKDNTAEGKDYYATYRGFAKGYAFAPDYLDQIYGAPYVTHFYSADEIAAFRKRWT